MAFSCAMGAIVRPGLLSLTFLKSGCDGSHPIILQIMMAHAGWLRPEYETS